MINLEIFNEKYQEAINHLDDKIAKELLKEMADFIVAKNLKTEYPKLYDKFQKAIINLKLVALPKLNDEESAEIIKNNFLDAIAGNIDMENRVTLKLFLIPFVPRDELREKMKMALEQNNQVLGSIPVSQWIQLFEKEYDVQTRSLSASSEFINSNKYAKNLDPLAKEHLKELLHIYDYLLVTTLPLTDPAVFEYLDSQEQGEMKHSQISEFSRDRLEASDSEESSNTASMSILEAIKMYPQTGEQIITTRKIELKNFREPVRPSVKNWLTDYISLLGYDQHDAIERSNYLFHTTNTRKLTDSERERVAYVLKAFDEKIPINIDTARKQIIFTSSLRNSFRPTPSPDPSAKRQDAPADSASNKLPEPPDIYEMYRINRNEPKQNLSAGKMFSPKKDDNIQEARFDYAQKMPFEKVQENNKKMLPAPPTSGRSNKASTYHEAEKTAPAAKKVEPINSNLQPYRITSSATRKEQEKPQVNPNNVIDLKNSK